MPDRFLSHHACCYSDKFADKVLAALKQQPSLQRLISALNAAPDQVSVDAETLQRAQTGIEALGDFVNNFLSSTYYNEQCPPHARDIAQKVFDIPEILERILLKLDAAKALKAQRVNRQFFDAIEKSVNLQRALSLRFWPQKHFWTLFEDEEFGICIAALCHALLRLQAEIVRFFAWTSTVTDCHELGSVVAGCYFVILPSRRSGHTRDAVDSAIQVSAAAYICPRSPSTSSRTTTVSRSATCSMRRRS